MEQLSGADSVFLSMETPTTPTHVGGLTILDTSEAPDFCFEKLLEVLEERIPIEPRYTMKLRATAYGIDRRQLRCTLIRNSVFTKSALTASSVSIPGPSLSPS